MSNYIYPVTMPDGSILYGVYQGVSGIHLFPLFESSEGLLDITQNGTICDGRKLCDCKKVDMRVDGGYRAKVCVAHKCIEVPGEMDD